ncbi:MAG: hypothetical protein U0133_11400 [Gemmatimonadales bacterium]
MARSLIRWLGGTAAAVVVLGAFYLPPRGMPTWAWRRMPIRTENESRLRARKLVSEFVEANAVLQELRFRARIDSALAARRAAGQVGPVLLLDQPDTQMVRVAPALQAGLDQYWKQLGLGDTKVTFAAIVRDPSTIRGGNLLYRFEMTGYTSSYILPDTVNRTTCLAQVRFPGWISKRKYFPPRYLTSWSAAALGPCAFYARFGVPSLRVEQWLGRRRFDLALYPAWNEPEGRRRSGYDDEQAPSFSLFEGIWRNWVYNFSPRVAGCYAGRPEACRASVAWFDKPAVDQLRPRAVLPYDSWQPSKLLLNGSASFLSEVARDAGPERFQDFWTTDLPVDSALTLALGKPVGDYTVEYQRRLGKAPRFGASARPLDVALSLLFGLVVVGLTLVAQGRREVR